MYTIFVSSNRASFHLWLKKNMVKHQKVSKYYENDCRFIRFQVIGNAIKCFQNEDSGNRFCKYRKIPLTHSPVYKLPRIYAPQICNPFNIPNISLPNIAPSNFSSLRNIKFTKIVTLSQAFSCVLLLQFICLVSL